MEESPVLSGENSLDSPEDINFFGLDLETGFGTGSVSRVEFRDIGMFWGNITVKNEFDQEVESLRNVLEEATGQDIQKRKEMLEPSESNYVGDIGMIHLEADEELARVNFRSGKDGESYTEYRIEYRDEELAKDVSFLLKGTKPGDIIEDALTEELPSRDRWVFRYEMDEGEDLDTREDFLDRIRDNLAVEWEETEEYLGTDFLVTDVRRGIVPFSEAEKLRVFLEYDITELDSYENPEERVDECYRRISRIRETVREEVERYRDELYERAIEPNG